jgi:hypothetical protein
MPARLIASGVNTNSAKSFPEPSKATNSIWHPVRPSRDRVADHLLAWPVEAAASSKRVKPLNFGRYLRLASSGQPESSFLVRQMRFQSDSGPRMTGHRFCNLILVIFSPRTSLFQQSTSALAIWPLVKFSPSTLTHSRNM